MIKGFSAIAEPLIELLKKQSEFVWGVQHEAAFEALKSSLNAPPILAHADPTKPFAIDIDASDMANGAVSH